MSPVGSGPLYEPYLSSPNTLYVSEVVSPSNESFASRSAPPDGPPLSLIGPHVSPTTAQYAAPLGTTCGAPEALYVSPDLPYAPSNASYINLLGTLYMTLPDAPAVSLPESTASSPPAPGLPLPPGFSGLPELGLPRPPGSPGLGFPRPPGSPGLGFPPLPRIPGLAGGFDAPPSGQEPIGSDNRPSRPM